MDAKGAFEQGRGEPSARVVIVGDTLHSDILGGAAQGWKTVLVTDHGLFAGLIKPRLDQANARADAPIRASCACRLTHSSCCQAELLRNALCLGSVRTLGMPAARIFVQKRN